MTFTRAELAHNARIRAGQPIRAGLGSGIYLGGKDAPAGILVRLGPLGAVAVALLVLWLAAFGFSAAWEAFRARFGF